MCSVLCLVRLVVFDRAIPVVYGGHARLDEELLFVLFGGRRALIKG